MAHGLPLPVIKIPRILGVDDWAYPKRSRYGTVQIDMETSRLIDLLPGRENEYLEQGSTDHPGVEVDTRDRSGAYAAAISKSISEALHVLARFHLLLNLSDALDKYFKTKAREIKTLMAPNQDTFAPKQGKNISTQKD